MLSDNRYPFDENERLHNADRQYMANGTGNRIPTNNSIHSRKHDRIQTSYRNQFPDTVSLESIDSRISCHSSTTSRPPNPSITMNKQSVNRGKSVPNDSRNIGFSATSSPMTDTSNRDNSYSYDEMCRMNNRVNIETTPSPYSDDQYVIRCYNGETGKLVVRNDNTNRRSPMSTEATYNDLCDNNIRSEREWVIDKPTDPGTNDYTRER